MPATHPTLFQHATIISFDESTRSLVVYRDASMLIENGRVAALTTEAIQDAPEGTELIDATAKIISPGFINTHHHMWQSAFRTLGANTTLIEYLSGRYSQTGPAGTTFTPDDVYLGQMASALEMVDGGTTTVLDHAHGVFSNEHIDAAVRASFECGLRMIYAHTIQPIETTGYTAEMGTKKLFDLSEDSRFAKSDGLVKLGVAYDAWTFVPPEFNTQFVNAVFNHNNDATSKGTAAIAAITTHMVAGPYRFDNGPVRLDSFEPSVLAQHTLTTPSKIPVIFSHASFMTSDDAKVLHKYPHVSISTTPESETHYGHTSAGAELCQDCASLGVDTHFTFSAFMPFQARLWLQLQRDQRYRQVTVEAGKQPINNPMDCEAAFLLMTQKGGEALGRRDLGVINIGAQADLVVFDTKSRPALWAARDPVAAVVLHTGSGGDVEAVMVQGKWLKRNYKIQDLDGGNSKVTVESIRHRFEASASRIQKVWEGFERSVFADGGSGLMGGTYGACKTVTVDRSI